MQIFRCQFFAITREILFGLSLALQNIIYEVFAA